MLSPVSTMSGASTYEARPIARCVARFLSRMSSGCTTSATHHRVITTPCQWTFAARSARSVP